MNHHDFSSSASPFTKLEPKSSAADEMQRETDRLHKWKVSMDMEREAVNADRVRMEAEMKTIEEKLRVLEVRGEEARRTREAEESRNAELKRTLDFEKKKKRFLVHGMAQMAEEVDKRRDEVVEMMQGLHLKQETTLSGLRKTFLSQDEVHERKMREMEELNAKAEVEREQAFKEVEELERELIKITERERIKEELARELGKRKAEFGELEREVRELDEAHAKMDRKIGERRISRQKEVDDLKAMTEEAENTVKEGDRKMLEKEERLAAIQSQIKELSAELERVTSQRLAKEKEAKDEEARLKENEDSLCQIKKLAADYSDEVEKKKVLDEEVQKLKDERDVADVKNKQLQQWMMELQEKEKGLEHRRSECESEAREIEKMQEENRELQQQLNKAKLTADEEMEKLMKETVDWQRKNEDLLSRNKELAELQLKVDEKLKVAQANKAEVDKKLEAAVQESDEKKLAMKAVEEDVAQKKKRIVELDGEIQSAKQDKTKGLKGLEVTFNAKLDEIRKEAQKLRGESAKLDAELKSLREEERKMKATKSGKRSFDDASAAGRREERHGGREERHGAGTGGSRSTNARPAAGGDGREVQGGGRQVFKVPPVKATYARKKK